MGYVMARRNKVKNPALKNQYNLKSRQDLIDFDYLDKLSEEDKSFLNDFVAETVNTNFLHDEELKRLNNIKSELQKTPEIQNITDHIKALKIDLSEASDADLKASIRLRIRELDKEKTLLKRANKTANEDMIKELDKQIDQRRKEVLLYPCKEQHKEFYNENNARNVDIYVDAMKQNKLFQLDPTEFDNYYSNMVSPDVESQWLNNIEQKELEEREMYIYHRLREMDTPDANKYIRKLDKCDDYEKLFFLLEEIDQTLFN